MSQSEEKKKAERPVEPPAAKAEEETKEAEKPQGLKYGFKIAPADPKNSFDFEDVADK